MKLTYNRNRFELLDTSTDESKTAEKAGMRLDSKKLCYFTLSAQIASKFANIADSSCLSPFGEHQANIYLSKSTGSNGLEFPHYSNLEYLPFQKSGIAYSLQRHSTLIGDDPGLGKTVTSIGIINAIPDIKSVLIICPAIIKNNWKRELERWYIRCNPSSIGIAYLDDFPQTDIVIVNYDILAPVYDMENSLENELSKKKPRKGVAMRYAKQADLREMIESRHWDLLICDECQTLMNADTMRTRAILGMATGVRQLRCPEIKATKRLFLSGTPMVNRPENLWTIIKACDPDDLGANWEYFATRYCKLWRAPWGWDSSGATNLEELQGRLRGKFMIRRSKQEVLLDLPAKRRQIVHLDTPKELDLLLDKEHKLFELSKTRIEIENEAAEAAMRASSQTGDWEGYKKVASYLVKEKFSDFSELSRIKHEIAQAKLPYMFEYIKLMLEEHTKIIVWAHHRDIIAALTEHFKSLVELVIITGDTIEKDRTIAIDKFQEQPKCRLIIISITISVGFTLTAASYGLMVELDWRSVVITQAEDRMHRIGQKNSVLIQHLVWNGSVDAQQVKRIIQKQEDIEKVLG